MTRKTKAEVLDAIWLAIVIGILYLLGAMVFSSSSNAQTRAQLEQRIVAAATSKGIDPNLALAIAEVESQFRVDAIGGLGEIGVFQMRPEFHPVVKGRPMQNIDVAIEYLAHLQAKCAGYGEAFFVCYNYGTARRLKHPTLFPYYAKVRLVMERRKGGYDVATRD